MTSVVRSALPHDPVTARRHTAALIAVTTAADLAARPSAIRVPGGVAAAGDLLVEGPGRARAALALSAEGFAVTGRAGPVLRLHRAGLTGEQTTAYAKRLGNSRCRVAPNHLVVAAAVGKFARVSPIPAPAPEPVPGDGGRGASVAVLDTAAPGGGLLTGADGHAGFVAGIVRHLAPGCDVRVTPVLGADGVGTDFDVAAALFALLEHPPTLVNLSLVAAAEGAPTAMAAALAALAEREVPVVAAAGNDARETPVWPAAAASVIAVGSPAPYANHGTWVDLAVPAEGVVSVFPTGVHDGASGLIEHHSGHAAWTGTSFAAAQVTATLAVSMSRGATLAEAVKDC